MVNIPAIAYSHFPGIFLWADNSHNKMGTFKGQLRKTGAVPKISPGYC